MFAKASNKLSHDSPASFPADGDDKLVSVFSVIFEGNWICRPILSGYFKLRQLVNLIKLICVIFFIPLLLFPQHSWTEISQACDVHPQSTLIFLPLRNGFL